MPDTVAVKCFSPSSTRDAAPEEPRDERRLHHRYSTTLEVQTEWQDEFGLQHSASGVVRDVSAGGFGLELTERPPLSAMISVEAMQGSMRCIVRHLRKEDDRFVVGLELLPELDGMTATHSLQRLAAALTKDRRTHARNRNPVDPA